MTPALIVNSMQFGWPKAGPILAVDHLEVGRGERVFLQGASGSGKSTFLGLVGGILQPQSGQVSVLGQDLGRLSGRARDRFRADHLGVVFQMFNLLPFLGVVENVLLGCQFSAVRRARLKGSGRMAATALLEALGLDLADIERRRVADLSVGQQQRVAAARALLGGPELIIADEPTSALDATNRDQFLGVLLDEVARSGASLIFVSHDDAFADQFDRRVALEDINSLAQQDGRLVS
jgi:putative ABC transport system ATP-binding protein